MQNLNCRAPGPPTFLPCSAWIIYYKASGGVIELIHDSYEEFPSLCGDQSEVIHVPHHIKSAMQSSRAVKAAHVLIYHPRNFQKQIDPLYLRLFTQLSYVHNERRPTRCAGGLQAEQKMFLVLGPIFESGSAAAIPRTLSSWALRARPISHISLMFLWFLPDLY